MNEIVAGVDIERSNERANELRSSARTEEIEVRIRQERHRRWKPDEKLQVVRETLRPGAIIAEVARRHGIGTGLLYTWRRAALATAVAGFVPVQVTPGAEASPVRRPETMSMSSAARTKPRSGRIEIELPSGIRVRVDGGVDEVALRGVLAALEGS